MLEPPDFDRAFKDERERATALAAFLNASVELDGWRELARSATPIPPDRRFLLSSSVEAGDTPELKLRRWSSLFDDELVAIMESRNRVVHGLRLSDREIRGAVWLAENLLGLLQPATAA